MTVARLQVLWSTIGKHTGTYLGASMVTAALPFLLLPVLTRALDPADYGRAAMFSVLVTTASQLVGLGSQGALGVRKFELEDREFSAYIRASLVILIRTAVVLAVATLLLQAPLGLATGLPLPWLMIAVGAATAQGILQTVFVVWVAESRAKTYGAVQISQMAVNLVLSIVFVVALGWGWQGRVLGIIVAVSAGAVVALAVLRAQHDLGPHLTVATYRKDALRFGLPLVPHALGGLLMVVTDRFIVSSVLGADAVGVYMVAAQIGLAISLFTESFNRAYSPWLMKRLTDDSVRDDAALVRTTYGYFALLLGSALALGFVAGPVVDLLAGREFASAAGLVKYIALGCAFTGCYYMVTNYVFFAGATKSLATITLSVGLANVPLTWALVRLWGLPGAAMSYALVQLVAFLATWWLGNRHHPMPWFGSRPAQS